MYTTNDMLIRNRKIYNFNQRLKVLKISLRNTYLRFSTKNNT